jgi:hypothetical protein
MPDQTNQTPEESQGLAAYLSPPEAPQYASPPDYKPDIQPFSTAGVFPAQTYAPPPNYEPPPQAAPVVPFERYHPGPLAQYASPPDYEGPSYDDATLSSRTVEQEPSEESPVEQYHPGRPVTRYGSGAISQVPLTEAERASDARWSAPHPWAASQQAHEARQLLPPPHMLEQPPPRDKMDAGVPAGAPVAEEKPKDEEKKS